MLNQSLNDAEIADLRHQLQELQVEHRDLDLVIAHLTDSPPPDDLLIRRLKKRKLALKDRILHLEQMLVPDIPA
ncbi:MAG: YdcH family protein [Candidatus Dechloromonas phosphoritropha]